MISAAGMALRGVLLLAVQRLSTQTGKRGHSAFCFVAVRSSGIAWQKAECPLFPILYYDAVRFSCDRRLSAGRQAKANKLQSRIRMICRRYGEELDDAAPGDDAKFVRPQNELVDHTEKQFVFACIQT